MNKFMFSPSLMCMDLFELEKQIHFFNTHADMLHIDVMDGHFVKNITLSPWFAKQVKRYAKIPVDVHLMVEFPEDYVDELIDCRTDYITLHPETLMNKQYRLAYQIKEADLKFGLAISPETDLSCLKYLYDLLDKVTIMTVEPGYSGGMFINEMMRKLAELSNIKQHEKYDFIIEVDGACRDLSYRDMVKNGAEGFVMGNTGLFRLDTDISKAWGIMLDIFKNEIGSI